MNGAATADTDGVNVGRRCLLDYLGLKAQTPPVRRVVQLVYDESTTNLTDGIRAQLSAESKMHLTTPSVWRVNYDWDAYHVSTILTSNRSS